MNHLARRLNGPEALSMNTAADCHPRESEDPGATRTKLWIPGLRLRLAGNDRRAASHYEHSRQDSVFMVRVQLPSEQEAHPEERAKLVSRRTRASYVYVSAAFAKALPHAEEALKGLLSMRELVAAANGALISGRALRRTPVTQAATARAAEPFD